MRRVPANIIQQIKILYTYVPSFMPYFISSIVLELTQTLLIILQLPMHFPDLFSLSHFWHIWDQNPDVHFIPSSSQSQSESMKYEIL